MWVKCRWVKWLGLVGMERDGKWCVGGMCVMVRVGWVWEWIGSFSLNKGGRREIWSELIWGWLYIRRLLICVVF